MTRPLVLILGAGDLATGAAYRLQKAGVAVVMTELSQPLAVRRTVSFAQAIYDGQIIIGGLTGQLASRSAEALDLAQAGVVAILVDPEGSSREALRPVALVDGRMAKHNLGIGREMARLVVALGPGFTAGRDCHAVVETNRGHNLGRVIWSGQAEPDTGIPAEIGGHGADRVLRAPVTGTIQPVRNIGDQVQVGQVLARVAGHPVLAPFPGVLRGMLEDGLVVPAGTKIGDLDPRARPEHCFTISDKALAVGGGVVEAVMSGLDIRLQIQARHHV